MPQTRSDYGKRIDQLHARIEARLRTKRFVFYSAYPTEGDHLPIDNLDDIAVEGKVQFFTEHNPFWGDGEDYTSPVVDSPTWLDVAVLANDMITTTGDRHHHFLEGVLIVDKTTEVKKCHFVRGS